MPFVSRPLTKAAHLIVMDEATNHLDRPSIQCLEEALVGCPCGLLLVSHDTKFLQRVTNTRWRITPAEPDRNRVVVSDEA